MKFATAALIATANATHLVSEESASASMWYIDGFRGFHDGFYKAMYKTSQGNNGNGCFNDETVSNLVTYGDLMMDPASIFSNIADIDEDFNLLADGSEIMENLSLCHFEGPAFDLMHMCLKDKEACGFPKLLENLTKNAFVLVGKATSLAETFKGFPAKENGDFKEQMSEFGDDAGTLVRTIFNFSK